MAAPSRNVREHPLIIQGRPLKHREDDSHDILGTYHAILESKANPVIPENLEDLARQLQELNRQVIESRQSKSPGEFKSESNRAGNTVFVMPDLVVGTLTEGYEIIMSAATPPNRAALAMFIVAEVHPFTAGSGRTARLAMNQFLTQSGLTRIITPTVYRDDYISALKAMSSNSRALRRTRHAPPPRRRATDHWAKLCLDGLGVELAV
jgi:hypothetical protein